jgi:response regulator RpfG family c-di-GMP phosphodiesterase
MGRKTDRNTPTNGAQRPAGRAQLKTVVSPFPGPPVPTPAPAQTPPASGAGPQESLTPRGLLQQLIGSGVILAEDWEQLTEPQRQWLSCTTDPEALLRGLLEAGLLTGYQAARVRAGSVRGLIVGSYRILDRLGAGGMGVVYRAEHVVLRRPVAVKLLAPGENDPRLLRRFLAETRAVARLQHPNIVAAFDAGEAPGPLPDAPPAPYLVMEYVDGQDLELMVQDQGPLDVAGACLLGRQVADALREAHRHGVVHRDVKPSNVLVTPAGVAKVLDFGLARHFSHRLTEPGMMLGTVGYMAPEQARDAASVDERADVYSLGCTLFWSLTGRDPFPGHDDPVGDLLRRLNQPAPAARQFRPSVPAELDAVLQRMMAVDPDDRYPSAEAVVRILTGFLPAEVSLDRPEGVGSKAVGRLSVPGAAARPDGRRVLIVDDEESVRGLCRAVLKTDGFTCAEAEDGPAALAALREQPADLVLLDMNLPGQSGADVLRQIRAAFPEANLKVILCSGSRSVDDLARLRLSGADDYLTKPFSPLRLRSSVQAALGVKEAQDRSDQVVRELLAANAQLEQALAERSQDLLQARNGLVMVLARLAEQRSCETPGHLTRLPRFCRLLAESAARLPAFAGRIDAAFIETLEGCVSLHDVGKMVLPDHILMKPGRLDAEERRQMQEHTTLGADILQGVARRHGDAIPFLRVAAEVARHHHERYDGTGYPDRLKGEAIPLAARIVAVADVYDALRSRRVYKPALAHASAVRTILENSPGQFDPHLREAFGRCAADFERVYKELVA